MYRHLAIGCLAAFLCACGSNNVQENKESTLTAPPAIIQDDEVAQTTPTDQPVAILTDPLTVPLPAPVAENNKTKATQPEEKMVKKAEPAPQKTKVSLSKNPLNAQWWNTLDDEWKNVFRKNLKFKDEPGQAEYDSIFMAEELNCTRANISSLAPLFPLKNLNRLNLMGTAISEIQEFDQLPQVEKVNLTYTKISQEKVDQLRQKYPEKEILPALSLSWWQSIDKEWRRLLMASAGLKKEPNQQDLNKIFALNRIVADKSMVNTLFIKDLTPLEKLSNIRYINLNNTQISDLTPLTRLKDLQVLLIAGTKVTDLSPVARMSALQELDCSMLKINNIDDLKNLTKLRKVTFYSTSVSDLSPLTNLKELTEIYCFDTKISSLAPLRNLDNLMVLHCSDTQISDLAPISGARRLRKLNISNTAVSSLQPIKNLIRIKELALAKTQVKSIDVVAGFDEISSLNIAYTEVASIDVLDGKRTLSSLDISHTKVSDLKALGKSTLLESLWITGTGINTIAPIMGLKNIIRLDCARTQVPASEIQKFKGLHPDCEIIQ